MTAWAAPQHTTVSVIMSRPVLTVETQESLWDAWQMLFVSGLRHLVAIDAAGAAVGVLSDRNILADVPATQEHLGNRQVKDVLPMAALVSVAITDEPITAARVMTANSIEAVPVLDAQGRILGIVTESDIVHWLAT